MTKFRVWVRSIGPGCRVRVDGIANANWLLGRLTQSNVMAPLEPLGVSPGAAICNFNVSYTPSLTLSGFESLLATIPEVCLMQEPE